MFPIEIRKMKFFKNRSLKNSESLKIKFLKIFNLLMKKFFKISNFYENANFSKFQISK